MPELWRKRKNHKPTGSWIVTIEGRRINTLTKDVNLARERARMAELGMWPPPKGMTAEDAHDAYEQQTAAAAADAALEATSPTARGGTMENGRSASGSPEHVNTPTVAGSSPAPSTFGTVGSSPAASTAPAASSGTAPPGMAPTAAPALPPIGASSAVHPDEVIPPRSSVAEDAAAAAAEAGASSDDDAGDPAAAAGGRTLDDLLGDFKMTRDDLAKLLGAAHGMACGAIAKWVTGRPPVQNDATAALERFAGPAALAVLEKHITTTEQLSPEAVLIIATGAAVGAQMLMVAPSGDKATAPAPGEQAAPAAATPAPAAPSAVIDHLGLS